MRFFALFFLIFSFLAAVALAQENKTDSYDDDVELPSQLEKQADRAAKPKVFELADDLDGLFAQLKRTRDAKVAKRISERIWSKWQESNSKSIDLLTNWARGAMQRDQDAAALDLLDQVIVIAPDYAEGWNQRATLHYKMENYGRSIADIEQTLAREPRHYGALAGLATILQKMGRDRDALETWYRTLSVYPAMKSAQDAVIKLEEKLAGDAL